MPTILDAYTTASLYNEAQLNDAYGLSEQPVLQFSPSDLEFYRNGLDPYGHPNVDWVNTVLAKQSSSARFSVDIRGGNKFVKYFTSLAYYTQGGMMKHILLFSLVKMLITTIITGVIISVLIWILHRLRLQVFAWT